MTSEIDVAGVWARALEMIRENLGGLLAFALLFVAAPNALSLAFDRVPSTGVGGFLDSGDSAGLSTVAVLLLGLFYRLVVIAALLAQDRRQEGDFVAALATALPLFLSALAVALLAWVAIILGLVALIVPGAILYCMFAVALPALVAERRGVFASLSRSRQLSEHNRMSIFGVFFLLGAGQGIAGLLVRLIVQASEAGQIVNLALTTILATVAALIEAPLTAALYVDLRLVKEGGLNEGLVQVFE